MTDMSVDKLLQKLYDGYESKIHAELLRRFEAMKCCGNCQWSISRNCKDWQRYRDCGSYPALDSYCDKWQSDNLSREEREGK